MLVGNYSRFVIDLNRPADDTPLYTTATGLYPETLFDGRDSFTPGMTPTAAHRRHYLAQIWHPYHQRIQSELARIKHQFGYAVLTRILLHRLSRVCLMVGLPDLNLGTNGGASCAAALSDRLVDCCQNSRHSAMLNGRFKGGYITRARSLSEYSCRAT